MSRRIPLWLAALVFLSCSEPQVGNPRARPIQQTTAVWLISGQRPVDLLFVIDNSASMAAKQTLVIQRLSTVIQQLQAFEGGIPDMHIGVVSTDLGAGAGEAGGDCAVPLGDRGLVVGQRSHARGTRHHGGCPLRRVRPGCRRTLDRESPLSRRR